MTENLDLCLKDIDTGKQKIRLPKLCKYTKGATVEYLQPFDLSQHEGDFILSKQPTKHWPNEKWPWRNNDRPESNLFVRDSERVYQHECDNNKVDYDKGQDNTQLSLTEFTLKVLKLQEYLFMRANTEVESIALSIQTRQALRRQIKALHKSQNILINGLANSRILD